MTWIFKDFYKLSVTEFHDLIKLRSDIFVVEQQCIYPELDGKDTFAIHQLGYQENILTGCSRIFPPENKETEIKIGRVAVRKDFRNRGIGRELFNEALRFISVTFPGCPVKISAQTYLTEFYSSFGFEKISPEYLDDGIPHIDMKMQPSNKK